MVRKVEILITVKQLAEEWQINPATIYSWVKARRIPHIVLSIGPHGKECVRFRKSELEEWLKERSRQVKDSDWTKWDQR